jgi:hypothetical protein
MINLWASCSLAYVVHDAMQKTVATPSAADQSCRASSADTITQEEVRLELHAADLRIACVMLAL